MGVDVPGDSMKGLEEGKQGWKGCLDAYQGNGTFTYQYCSNFDVYAEASLLHHTHLAIFGTVASSCAVNRLGHTDYCPSSLQPV